MSIKHCKDYFKKQIFYIYNQGNQAYGSLSIYMNHKIMVVRDSNTKSFNAGNNIMEGVKRIIELKKKVRQLEMENNILKQVALLLDKKYT